MASRCRPAVFSGCFSRHGNRKQTQSQRIIIGTDYRRCLCAVYLSANLILTCLLIADACLEQGKPWKAMESHGKSWNTCLEVQACSGRLPPTVSLRLVLPSLPPLIGIPPTEPLSLRLYDCVPVLGIRFDAAVDR